MFLNKIKDVSAVDDLKAIGSIEEITKELEIIVKPLKICVKSYEELFEVIVTLKEKWVDFSDNFFCNKQKEYLFYLTKLDGKKRNDLIGLTDELYDNEDMLKKWYREILKTVHSDINKDELADSAVVTLNKLYKSILETFGEDEIDE